jgi:hypothetical protein
MMKQEAQLHAEDASGGINQMLPTLWRTGGQGDGVSAKRGLPKTPWEVEGMALGRATWNGTAMG